MIRNGEQLPGWAYKGLPPGCGAAPEELGSLGWNLRDAFAAVQERGLLAPGREPGWECGAFQPAIGV